MRNREFVQLGVDYDPAKHGIAGFYMSEKYDGMRCLWDGGVTRGKLVSEVCFANRTRDQRDVTCTGLWSRYGKVIHAPDWMIDQLPLHMLDGELYINRGEFNKTVSTVKKLTPDDDEWSSVKYLIFDAPSYKRWMTPGKINNPIYSMDIGWDFVHRFAPVKVVDYPFRTVFALLKKTLSETDNLQIVKQEQLPMSTAAAIVRIEEKLNEIVGMGGEGLILRDPNAEWTPYRTNYVCKVKPLIKGTGVIIGITPGKGKLEGMMGSLHVSFLDVTFNLSGFTEEERRREWTMGEEINFIYRELNENGLPREARYSR